MPYTSTVINDPEIVSYETRSQVLGKIKIPFEFHFELFLKVSDSRILDVGQFCVGTCFDSSQGEFFS